MYTTKQVLQYLYRTQDLVFIYFGLDSTKNNNGRIVRYTEFNLANDTDDTKSISGYIFKLDKNTI